MGLKQEWMTWLHCQCGGHQIIVRRKDGRKEWKCRKCFKTDPVTNGQIACMSLTREQVIADFFEDQTGNQ